MGIAAPSFDGAMQSSKMVGHYNSLSASLTFARSEAIKRSSHVSVCAKDTDNTCGEDWTQGWLVFNDEGPTRGFIDPAEDVLKRVAANDDQLDLTNLARLSTGSATPVERPFIRFGPRGTSNWRGAGYFLFCDKRGTQGARVANVSLSGDVRRARRDGSNNLINAFGGATTCP